MNHMSEMGQGKAPYNVAKRSVLRPIKKERKQCMGDGIGQLFSCCNMENEALVTSSACYVMGNQVEDAIKYAFFRVENEILSAGGKLIGVHPMFVFPSETDEILAAVWSKNLDLLCEETACQVLGIDAIGSSQVKAPICMLTGYGVQFADKPNVLPDWDIVAAGHTGMEGISMLVREKREALSKRFSFEFIEQAEAFMDQLSVRKMLAGIQLKQPVLIHALGEGGVMAGLWNLAERTGLGLHVYLKEIPIRQETVEISEFFGLNPYQMMADGMVFFVTLQGEELAGQIRRMGIQAHVIGKMTNKKERVIENGEEKRFLDRPAVDEMYKAGILV